ncbi:MAG: carboxypeptidase-like regulatory domain-containing protein [Blastocatellia bacterium]
MWLCPTFQGGAHENCDSRRSTVNLLSHAYLRGRHVGTIKSGTITGAVTDANGAAVAGAQARVINEETNIATEVATGEQGEFSVPYLIPGRYAARSARRRPSRRSSPCRGARRRCAIPSAPGRR